MPITNFALIFKGEQFVLFLDSYNHTLQIHTAHSVKSKKNSWRNIIRDSTFGSSRNT